MDGGFLIKINGKDAERCHACSFDYDLATYTVNNGEPKPFPDNTKKIEVILEHQDGYTPKGHDE